MIKGIQTQVIPPAYKSLSQVWFLRVYRARGLGWSASVVLNDSWCVAGVFWGDRPVTRRCQYKKSKLIVIQQTAKSGSQIVCLSSLCKNCLSYFNRSFCISANCISTKRCRLVVFYSENWSTQHHFHIGIS